MPQRFSCSCGAVTGHVADSAFAKGTRGLCHCADCRASVKHITGTAPAHVDLFFASTNSFSYDTGFENLAVLHMSPKGVHRVYATCCGSPMHIVAPLRRLSYANIFVDRLNAPDQAGPVQVQVNMAEGPKHTGLGRFLGGAAGRAVSGLLNGTWRDGPFFDPAGALTMPVHLISLEDKAKAYS